MFVQKGYSCQNMRFYFCWRRTWSEPAIW